MKMTQRVRTQVRGMTIAIGLMALIGGGWWWHETWGWHLPMTIPQAAQPDAPMNKDMAGMKMEGMSGSSSMTPSRTKVSPLQQTLIGMQTAIVKKRQLSTTVRAVGQVAYNEQHITHVNLRISGWIEDLLVDFTGQHVKKGQALFTLYSPELLATQEDYVLALQAKENIQQSPLPHLQREAQQVIDAAADRLRLWTFTDAQIATLTEQRIPKKAVTFFSPVSGYVINKTAFQGMFVKPDLTLYTIADLSTIWVQAEVYEYELPFIQVGQSASLKLEAFPGEDFAGRVAYVYPYLNKKARTVQIRLEFSNPQVRLKPDMYGTVIIHVDRGSRLAVPAQAVLDSGRRQIVYVRQEQGMFEPREITLGPKVGSYFEVIHGLREGEHIVTAGTFLLDSESQLMSSSNMMGALGMGGVKMEQAQMGKMDMGGMDMKNKDKDGMNMMKNMKKETGQDSQ